MHFKTISDRILWKRENLWNPVIFSSYFWLSKINLKISESNAAHVNQRCCRSGLTADRACLESLTRFFYCFFINSFWYIPNMRFWKPLQLLLKFIDNCILSEYFSNSLQFLKILYQFHSYFKVQTFYAILDKRLEYLLKSDF